MKATEGVKINILNAFSNIDKPWMQAVGIFIICAIYMSICIKHKNILVCVSVFFYLFNLFALANDANNANDRGKLMLLYN